MSVSSPHLERLSDRFRTYTLKEVATIVRKSSRHLYRCIRAAQDEGLRQKYGIGISSLRRLPVLHWFQNGGQWVIRESDLLAQLGPIRALIR
jgi:hypothetical protein